MWLIKGRRELTHNRTRRSVRHSWAALVELSPCHRVELPIQLRELSVSFSISL